MYCFVMMMMMMMMERKLKEFIVPRFDLEDEFTV